MSVDGRDASGTDDDATTDRGAPRRRGAGRAVRVGAWLVAIAVWVTICFVWLFPWLTELGLDPTLGG